MLSNKIRWFFIFDLNEENLAIVLLYVGIGFPILIDG
jgi:hypothetical protein